MKKILLFDAIVQPLVVSVILSAVGVFYSVGGSLPIALLAASVLGGLWRLYYLASFSYECHEVDVEVTAIRYYLEWIRVEYSILGASETHATYLTQGTWMAGIRPPIETGMHTTAIVRFDGRMLLKPVYFNG